jgi:hypothetical protein
MKPAREPVCPVCLLPYPWGDMSGWGQPPRPCYDCAHGRHLQFSDPPEKPADRATRKD